MHHEDLAESFPITEEVVAGMIASGYEFERRENKIFLRG